MTGGSACRKSGGRTRDGLSWKQHKKLKKARGEAKLIKLFRQNQRLQEVVVDGVVNGTTAEESPAAATEESPTSARVEATATRRRPTVSIALPGSILDNAQSLELRTYLAGQIGRAAAVFRVDEIVIFDEAARLTAKDVEVFESGSGLNPSNSQQNSSACNLTLARILQYLECPQYLRKQLFPLQRELKFAGLLNPLDCSHHLRSDELSQPYREAIVLSKPVKEGRGSYCDAGLPREVQVDARLEAGVRVTVKLAASELSSFAGQKKWRGTVVSPSEPKEAAGLYWGYSVRLARSISDVVAECPYEGGYDCCVGTSERGDSIDSFRMPDVSHLLVVFGGLRGLESCVENDQQSEVTDPAQLFHYYLNTCPQQGSRTIRTEEAILVTMSVLRSRMDALQPATNQSE